MCACVGLRVVVRFQALVYEILPPWRKSIGKQGLECVRVYIFVLWSDFKYWFRYIFPPWSKGTGKPGLECVSWALSGRSVLSVAGVNV